MGRNPVEDVYTEDCRPFEFNKATWVRGNADEDAAGIAKSAEELLARA